MRSFTLALCLTMGCKFSVKPVSVAFDAAIPDQGSSSSDDLSVVADLSSGDAPPTTEPDMAGAPPDQASSSSPDMMSLPDLMPPADLMPAPTCSDNILNGNESATDCGGSTCPKCSDGKTCRGGGDCLSTHCLSGKCVECLTGSQCGAPLEFCVQNSCSAITNGLVAYLKMDETSWTNDCTTASADDSTGNGHTGRACPVPFGMGARIPSANSPGKFGTAGSFGPGESHIDISASTAFDTGTGNFTVSIWANFNSLTADAPVFDWLESGNAHQVLLHHAATGWAFEQRSAGSTTNTVILNQGAATTTTAAWHNLAMVRSGNAWTLYLDGTSIATANNAIGIIGGGGLTLGWSMDHGPQLNGFLDEFRFYNRALSAAEIASFSQ